MWPPAHTPVHSRRSGGPIELSARLVRLLHRWRDRRFAARVNGLTVGERLEFRRAVRSGRRVAR